MRAEVNDVLGQVRWAVHSALSGMGGLDGRGAFSDTEAWRGADRAQLVEKIMVNVRAGIAPVLEDHVVRAGTRVAEELLAAHDERSQP